MKKNLLFLLSFVLCSCRTIPSSEPTQQPTEEPTVEQSLNEDELAARNAEISFEAKLLDIVNNNELVRSNNIHFDNLNLTSATYYYNNGIKLPIDKTEGDYSISVVLGANPYKDIDGEFQFELIYEFFITLDEYKLLVSYYGSDFIPNEGINDYLYETYNSSNPLNSPIFVLDSIFKKNKENLGTLICKGKYLNGISVESVIEIINELPDELNLPFDTLDEENFNKTNYQNECRKLLKEFDKQIEECCYIYSSLYRTIQKEVTNFEKLNDAISLYNVREVEYLISLLPKVEEFKFTSIKAVMDAIDAFDRLTEEEKLKVFNKDFLDEIAYEFPLFLVDYYLEKIDERKCLPEDSEFNSYKVAVKGVINAYSDLNDEQKAALKENGKYDIMIAEINEYNELVIKESDKVMLPE